MSKPKNSKDDQSKVKNADDDASKSFSKIKLTLPNKKRDAGSCSGATNSKTDGGTNSKPDIGTNSKPDIGTNSKPDGPPKFCKKLSSDNKDVNKIVTESRPREMGIHGDGVPHSKVYVRSSHSNPCLVDNCEKDGGFFGVCVDHTWSSGVSVNGNPSTYCHLCGLFQKVEDFDPGRHSCKSQATADKGTEKFKEDGRVIPTKTELKKIFMAPRLKDTSKEDLHGSKFKGVGINDSADTDSKPCQVDNCNVDKGFNEACMNHRRSHDVSVNGKRMRFCHSCTRFQGISDFDPGSLICKSRARVEKETPEKDAPATMTQSPKRYSGSTDESKLLKLTEEMHSKILHMGTQMHYLVEDTEKMQKEIEKTQQEVQTGNWKLLEEVRTSNKRLREDMERGYTSLQKNLTIGPLPCKKT